MSPSHDRGIENTNFQAQFLPVVKRLSVLCLRLINDFVGKFYLMDIVNRNYTHSLPFLRIFLTIKYYSSRSVNQ